MLKHIAFIVGLACMGASCTTSQVKEDYTNALLPTPVEMKTQSGSYTLKKRCKGSSHRSVIDSGCSVFAGNFEECGSGIVNRVRG